MKNDSGNILLVVLAVIAVVVASIGGYFWWTSYIKTPVDKQAQVIPDSKPKKASPSTDPTTNWKTYTNTSYGYSFQYSASWKLNEGLINKDPNLLHYIIVSGTELSEDQKKYLGMSILMRVQKKLQNCYETAIRCYQKNELTNTQIGKMSALKLDSFIPAEGGYDISQKLRIIIFEKDNLTYNISIQFPVEEEKNYLEKFDQILSTFKFLDQK